MDQENKNQNEEVEINLKDYVRLILKNKWLILAIFLIAIIGAGIFSYFTPKIYPIDTILEIGRVGGQIENPSEVAAKINGNAYRNLIKSKLNIPSLPEIIANNITNTNLVAIKIKSINPEKDKNILQELNNLIQEEHQEKIKTGKETIENNIKITENKIGLIEDNIEKIRNKIRITESDIEKTKNKIKPLENDIKRIENKIEYTEEEKENLEAKVEALQKILPYQQDPGTQFALFDAKERLASKKSEIENLYSNINSLKIGVENLNLEINYLEKTKEDYNSQINSLKTATEDLNVQVYSLTASLRDIRQTKILEIPTVSEKPIKPRPLYNMMIAGIFGLFVGIFLAFGKEWWQQNK